MKSHDKADSLGFDVPVQQLAHDLAIAKITNDKSLSHDADGVNENTPWTDLDKKYFDRYKLWYDHFLRYLGDQTRYDSAFKN